MISVILLTDSELQPAPIVIIRNNAWWSVYSMTIIISWLLALNYFHTGFHWIIGFIRSWIFIRLPLVKNNYHPQTTFVEY